MATRKSQRVVIWIIVIVMLAGTLGGFLAMVLAPKNQASDQAKLDQLNKEYQIKMEEYEQQIANYRTEKAKELSGKYYGEFVQYSSRVGEFDTSAVTELKKEDLKQGDGEEITSSSTFYAYYIGWNPSGKVFDQSIEGESLKYPIEASIGRVISGWTEGAEGMKVGGVRELTIPADKAYGEAGSGEDIPANTPLKFVIMVIPAPSEADMPQRPKLSEEHRELFARVNNIDPSLLENF